ncbi:MAG: glycosyl hydrolase [Cyclobacteriaceae bacterium]
MKIKILLINLILILSLTTYGQESGINEKTVKGLKLRNIGPAFTSGRIGDIAIHPENENIWYVAVASGGVWKTTNAGMTWDPIFDDQKVYSIGCITIDPNNPHTIWVGTGENVGGRHVGFGDGIYKSEDDGASWTNVGLPASEHISKIIVHPDNSDVVWVAVQGPLWTSGGERGLYKTTDGGKSWNKVLGGNVWTGVTDIAIDPRDPNWIYAATWQRHRTVAAYMGGGPGSGLHRSTDGGASWEKLSSGIPKSNLGKIGLAISPHNPDVLYAAIELDLTEGGVFMSTNRGKTWTKQSNAVSGGTGPHYYQELYASPHFEGTLYMANNSMIFTEDHGKTFKPLPREGVHSDSHSLNFSKSNPDYLLMGTDGGIYVSVDGTKTWRFIDNMPITQYYKLAVDDAEPFYNVYGGTQDNGSHGGPSRTDNQHGIRNADWWKTLGADGHQSAIEPGNPNITYAETQGGGLHRIDQITGDQVFIQPQPKEGEPYERFNWDAPILVSPHNPAKLYVGSYRVWKSENRGDSWDAISGDLTRGQERIKLPIMGGLQSWNNPWDLRAMSNYSTITSLAESPLKEGLVYAGTDDGIIQVTEDGGTSWRKTEIGSIKGLPATAFVNDVRADLFDESTVYVAFDNHKYGDFKPYLIKSTDAGRTWKLISESMPAKHLVWRTVQDHVDKNLIFAATEFGILFTNDGGNKWTKLTGGVPTISFRDITIQRRENDLVAASFGRSFFILDDISPLRNLTDESLNQEAKLFATKDAYWYNQRSLVSSQGGAKYVADNPPFGAVFTYHLKEKIGTLKDARSEKEKALIKQNQDVPFPGWDALEAEERQEEPKIVLTIKDADGNVVNRVNGKNADGFNRVNWNLSVASKNIVRLEERSGRGGRRRGGMKAVPGTYSVTLSKVVDGVVTDLSGPQEFKIVPLRKGALDGASFDEIEAITAEVQALQQEISATDAVLSSSLKLIKAMQTAVNRMSKDAPDLITKIAETKQQLLELSEQLDGSEEKDRVGVENDPTPGSRLSVGMRGLRSTYGPTDMHKENIALARTQLKSIKTAIVEISERTFPALEKALKDAGAPWIEGQTLSDY